MPNLYKILFMLTTASGTLISVSSCSWMGMWLGLEINLLSVIPLFSKMKNTLSSESALKYFITQALASMIFLFGMIMMMYSFKINTNFIQSTLISMMMNSALLTKMGAAPFHFWFPEVMEGLSWMNCLILLTWQKIAPMVLLMYNTSSTLFFSIIIISSMMISSVMALNQTSLRKILTYSSINHIGWMIGSIMMMETIWFYYFLIYSVTTFNIIMIMNLYKINQFKQIFPLLENNFYTKLLFILNFFSLGGIPPFIGFLPKWLIIQALIQNNFINLSLIMIMMTLIMLYTYMRLIFSTLIMNTNSMNFTKNSFKFKKPIIMFMNFLVIISLILCTTLFNWI